MNGLRHIFIRDANPERELQIANAFKGIHDCIVIRLRGRMVQRFDFDKQEWNRWAESIQNVDLALVHRGEENPFSEAGLVVRYGGALVSIQPNEFRFNRPVFDGGYPTQSEARDLIHFSKNPNSPRPVCLRSSTQDGEKEAIFRLKKDLAQPGSAANYKMPDRFLVKGGLQAAWKELQEATEEAYFQKLSAFIAMLLTKKAQK